MMAVVDASVCTEAFSEGPRVEVARDAISGNRGDLFAPHLIDAEVGHSLRRLNLRGEVSTETVESSLAYLTDLPLTRTPHNMLLGEAWAMRENVSFYDALYLALAKLLGTRLLTFDRRLARAAAKLGVEAELLA